MLGKSFSPTTIEALAACEHEEELEKLELLWVAFTKEDLAWAHPLSDMCEEDEPYFDLYEHFGIPDNIPEWQQ